MPVTGVGPWEYRVEKFLNPEVERMRNDLNRVGAEGWELVSLSSTVKKVAAIGNEMVAVFKRPGLGKFSDPDAGWGG